MEFFYTFCSCAAGGQVAEFGERPPPNAAAAAAFLAARPRPSPRAAASPRIPRARASGRLAGQRPRGHFPVRSSRRVGTARRYRPAPRGLELRIGEALTRLRERDGGRDGGQGSSGGGER